MAVAGAGRSGLSAAALAAALGARVRILEKNSGFDTRALSGPELSNVELVLGAHKKEHFLDADLVVVSPGIPVQNLRRLIPHRTKIVSELEMASWFTHEPIIAVTGTSGKTTTTMLITHALRKWGKTVFAGGNLGTPLGDYVLRGEPRDILVLEVSSFQLEGCSGFHPRVGIFLNFSANHLDHHRSQENYFRAKTRLFARQKDDDLAIIALDLKDEMEKSNLLKCKRVYFAPSGLFFCPALLGEHNQGNMEAAFLACRFFGMNPDQFSSSLMDFAPPPHRQEIFLKYDGKTFVNDSKATTCQAMSVALKAFEGPLRLFAGGVFKGGDFSSLAPLIKKKVIKIYLFGDSRQVFESAWRDAASMEYFPDLEQAVSRALSESAHGETLLLSPGTASFDLFSDYEQRGNVFKTLVARELGLSKGSDPSRNL